MAYDLALTDDPGRTGYRPNFTIPGVADEVVDAAPKGLRSPSPVQEALAKAARSMRDPAGGIRAAGASVGNAAVSGVRATSGALKSAGAATARAAGGSANGILSGVSAVAGHGNAYFDDEVPFTDKLRMGATDAVAGVGAAGGALFGAGAGGAAGSVVPVVGNIAGAVAGGVAGGYGGERLGRKVGNFLFGGDEAQSRNGYDPSRGLFEVAQSGLRGEGQDSFGRKRDTNYSNEGRNESQGISLGNPNVAPSEAYSNEGRNYTTAGAATSVPGNSVTRVGNAFSGSNIRDGFSTNGKGESTMNSAPGFGFDAALEQRTADARQGAIAAQRTLDSYGPGPNGGGMTGIRSSGKVTAINEAEFNASRRQYLLEQGLNSRNKGVRDASARGIAEGDPAAGLGANERIAGLREQGETARATAQQNTALRMNRDNNDVSLRGQDVQLQGQRATARLAQQTAERDQGNKDRQYQLDVGKFGKEVADSNLAQRTSRENQIQKNIESRAVGPDNKPDMKQAAEYRTGIDRSVARMNLKGPHELTSRDEQRLMDGTDLLRTMKANSGWLAWNPDQLKTIDPYDLTDLRVLPNGDRQITRPGKAGGQIIPRRFFDTEEGVRFFGGTKTNRYDMLSEGAQ